MEILLYYIAFCNVEDKAKDSEIKRNWDLIISHIGQCWKVKDSEINENLRILDPEIILLYFWSIDLSMKYRYDIDMIYIDMILKYRFFLLSIGFLFSYVEDKAKRN